MKKRVIYGLFSLVAFILLVAPIAAATTGTPYGGTWSYGGGSGKVWSNFYHGSRTHGSSVQGQYYQHSGWRAAGSWSYASAPDRWWAADESYYSFP